MWVVPFNSVVVYDSLYITVCMFFYVVVWFASGDFVGFLLVL